MARVEDDEGAVTFELNESDLSTSLQFNNEVSAAEHAGAAPESKMMVPAVAVDLGGAAAPGNPTLCNRQGTR